MFNKLKIGLLIACLAFVLPTLSEASQRGSPPKTTVLSHEGNYKIYYIISQTSAIAITGQVFCFHYTANNDIPAVVVANTTFAYDNKFREIPAYNFLKSVRPDKSLYSERSTESIIVKNDVGWQTYNKSYISKLSTEVINPIKIEIRV